jgi:hypothetical protein
MKVNNPINELWTKEDVAYLTDNYMTQSNIKIANIIITKR